MIGTPNPSLYRPTRRTLFGKFAAGKAFVKQKKLLLRILGRYRAPNFCSAWRSICAKLGLSEGDKLDVFEKDGIICMMPVAVYPQKYLDELCGGIDEVKAKTASGEQPVFDNVDALFAKLEAD